MVKIVIVRIKTIPYISKSNQKKVLNRIAKSNWINTSPPQSGYYFDFNFKPEVGLKRIAKSNIINISSYSIHKKKSHPVSI